MELKTGKIIKIEDFNNGIRVLLDFMVDFDLNNFILVGNTMEGFIPVVPENHPSDNYKPRRFRFNIGALHQYILVNESSCLYADEIVSGDKVMVTHINDKESNYTYQEFTVGRVKKEIRDFKKISVLCEGHVISAILQKGETTAILTPNGYRHLTELKTDDEIFVCLFGQATHLGNVVSEYIKEE